MRLVSLPLLFASVLAGPALAQGGPKPAPTRVPAQAAAVRMSQSPEPTFDEGTICCDNTLPLPQEQDQGSEFYDL